jgi:transposase
VDHGGIPLAIRLTAANVNDCGMLDHLLATVPAIKTPSGQRRTRPAKVQADNGYDYARCRLALRQRRFTCRIERVGIEPKARLGRHRWVVERTLAWLGQFRRLHIRDERWADIHQAFLTLACAMICFRNLAQTGS